MLTPQQFVVAYFGKAIDYDQAYGVQCVDGFKQWLSIEGIPVVSCPNNWAESYWTCRNVHGQIVESVKAWQEKYFTKITNKSDFKNGDWVIWLRGSESHPQSHVAMYFNGQEFCERQYEDHREFTLKNTNFSDAAGALRWKNYERMIVVPKGDVQQMIINDHAYVIQRQNQSQEIFVLSNGLNTVSNIEDFDCDAWLTSKISGANFYQAKKDIPGQDYGMTFGDISSPENDVYQSLPTQDSTLFYDLTTGDFGDCSQIEIDRSHRVYSPCLVYPNSHGNWEYARMVGLSHKNDRTWYTFCVRYNDGYAIGKAMQQLTPQEIADDFELTDMINIAFLDGGASAQGGFYDRQSETMQYIKNANVPVASALAIGVPFADHPPIPDTSDSVTDSKPTPAPVPDPVPQPEPDTDTDGGNDMSTNEEQHPDPSPVPDWSDPEKNPEKVTVGDRLAALIDVKSIITITATFVFWYLVVNQKEIPEFFAEMYKLFIIFYFGYQTGKATLK